MLQKNQDRKVELTGPEGANDAMGMLRNQSQSMGITEDAIPKFKQVKDYTTFNAEHAMIGGDVVVHFFRPKGVKVDDVYWKETFANALSAAAQEHFQAGYPRLAAKFTEEVDSWWFRARNYEHILDIDHYMDKFYGRVDALMDSHLPGTG